MINLLALAVSAFAALSPIKVHVDGSGYLRFMRDGRVVYAKTATFVSVGGLLGSEGATILPEIPLASNVQTLTIDLQGNVESSGQHLGRLVIAMFPPGSTSSTTDDFFVFEERPTLANPGDGSAGVVRVDGDPMPRVTPAPAARTKSSEPKPADPKPQVLTARTEAPVRTVHAASKQKDAGAHVEIIVRQHSEVVGDQFSIGDIATVNGPDEVADAIRKVNVGTTTIVGYSRVIDPRYVAIRLRGAGYQDGSYVLVVPDGADVARKSKTVTTDEIADAAIKAAQAKAGVNLEFRVAGSIKPIVAKDGDITLETSDPEPTAKGFLVTVTAREGDVIVGAESITLSLPADIVSIKSGDTVKVLFKSGTASIEVEGKALSAGYLGQKIKVSVSATPNGGNGSITTHTGKIIDVGTVEVDL